MKEDALIDLGFSKNEAKVYYALLRLGPSAAKESSLQNQIFTEQMCMMH